MHRTANSTERAMAALLNLAFGRARGVGSRRVSGRAHPQSSSGGDWVIAAHARAEAGRTGATYWLLDYLGGVLLAVAVFILASGLAAARRKSSLLDRLSGTVVVKAFVVPGAS